jgi:hypothetical protein
MDLDTFTKANSTTDIGATSQGRTWSQVNGTLGITSNTVYTPSSVGGVGALAVVDMGTPDVLMMLDVTNANNDGESGGIVFRYVDNNNFWVLNRYRTGPPGHTDEIYITKTVAGVQTVVAAVLQGTSGPDRLILSCRGSSIWARWVSNSTPVGSFTDTDLMTATKHGINIANSPNIRLDNWLCVENFPWLHEAISDQPAGLWLLNETSGTQARDLSGNDLHGTYTGSLTLASAPVNGYSPGKVPDFTGGYVDLPNNTLFSADHGVGFATRDQLTIESWFNADSLSAAEMLLAKHLEWNIRLESNGSITWFVVNTASNALMETDSAAGAIVTGNRYQVVGVYNHTIPKIETFKNGSSINNSTSVSGSTPSQNGNNPQVGRRSDGGGNVFDGRLGFVAIYPSALNSTRISAHYTAGLIGYLTASDNAPATDVASQPRRSAADSAPAVDLAVRATSMFAKVGVVPILS